MGIGIAPLIHEILKDRIIEVHGIVIGLRMGGPLQTYLHELRLEPREIVGCHRALPDQGMVETGIEGVDGIQTVKKTSIFPGSEHVAAPGRVKIAQGTHPDIEHDIPVFLGRHQHLGPIRGEMPEFPTVHHEEGVLPFTHQQVNILMLTVFLWGQVLFTS